MLELLRDIAADSSLPCDEDNPLRQVIVNTQSPAVFQQAPEGDVLVAELVEDVRASPADNAGGRVRFLKLQFSCLEGTWRAWKIEGHRITGKGNLLAYLNPSAAERDSDPTRRRVMDREEVQMLLAMPSNG